MDMNILKAGQDFDELPETHVIFITRNDVLGYGLPIYHIGTKIEEIGADFHDEAYIIYVNSSRQDDTELGRLMHDFHCKDPEDIHREILTKRVYHLKETAITLAGRGMSASEIADIVKASVEMVQEWLSEK